MNNTNYIQQFFQKKNLLTLENPMYQKLVRDLFSWLLVNDQADNDLTTKSLFAQEEKTAHARIITRQEITVAGLEEIEYLITTFTKLSSRQLCEDANHGEKNQTLIEIEGDIREILAYERVILNVLQRFCGIATETAAVVSKIHGEKPFIAATRKTPWGLLDKKAVAMGGGMTHRLHLSDGILVKDNHLTLINADDALEKLLGTIDNTLIEIEVEDEINLQKLVNQFTQTKTDNVLGILLDNFTPEKTKKILAEIEKQPNIIYEASGGITSDNIDKWAESGVDIISLGALTHSPKAADVSLEIY